MECLALAKTEGLENHRRGAKPGKRGLNHVKPRKNRQKQPILGYIKGERHRDQHNAAGKDQNSSVNIHTKLHHFCAFDGYSALVYIYVY